MDLQKTMGKRSEKMTFTRNKKFRTTLYKIFGKTVFTLHQKCVWKIFFVQNFWYVISILPSNRFKTMELHKIFKKLRKKIDFDELSNRTTWKKNRNIPRSTIFPSGQAIYKLKHWSKVQGTWNLWLSRQISHYTTS